MIRRIEYLINCIWAPVNVEIISSRFLSSNDTGCSQFENDFAQLAHAIAI